MAAIASYPVYTYNILPFGTENGATLVASVISADTTATALLLNCAPGVDGGPTDQCALTDARVTFGPWAQMTPPPNANTGVWDAQMVLTDDVVPTITTTIPTDSPTPKPDETTLEDLPTSLSVHCDITGTTIPAACTWTQVGATDSAPLTITRTGTGLNIFAPTPVPIYITAGVDKLDALASSDTPSNITTNPSNGITTQTSNSSSRATGAPSISSQNTTTTPSATAPVHTGAASSSRGVHLGSIGLLVLAASVLFL
ncbi:hypothetical protein ANO11243_050960 [Dothideomycetidae sp. 11243]|nr:hypothetical protein ANO11243_050960 [fungal sp. No.11243]